MMTGTGIPLITYFIKLYREDELTRNTITPNLDEYINRLKTEGPWERISKEDGLSSSVIQSVRLVIKGKI